MRETITTDILNFEKTDFENMYIVNSFFSEDNRGNFVKCFEKDVFSANGIQFTCNEVLISHSTKYVIRGLHFQTVNPQAKLVGVIDGKVFDVVVDLRKNSKTYGQWRGYYLSKENRNSLYIPKGCAHGFLSLSDDSVVSYLCNGPYDKNSDTGIHFKDKDIGIQWPIMDFSKAVISARDNMLMSFRNFEKINPFTLEE